jgi:hypothetical protein
MYRRSRKGKKKATTNTSQKLGMKFSFRHRRLFASTVYVFAIPGNIQYRPVKFSTDRMQVLLTEEKKKRKEKIYVLGDLFKEVSESLNRSM